MTNRRRWTDARSLNCGNEYVRLRRGGNAVCITEIKTTTPILFNEMFSYKVDNNSAKHNRQTRPGIETRFYILYYN